MIELEELSGALRELKFCYVSFIHLFTYSVIQNAPFGAYSHLVSILGLELQA